ncbi:MAG: sodium-independent anion transporter [Bacteroidetes bacterium]|nr:MAG: sodium-independent anion transporter [Bacteroidota bacterium]
MRLHQYIPILEWLPKYRKADLKGDLSAGLTVGVMLIPQGMAYAMIAGMPPIYGLYAATLPLILYAIFGTSRHLAVGPVAMVSLLTAAGIGTMAELGTSEYIALALTLALLVGGIQFLFGVFRLGFMVNFLSHPVISGFTSAAALIIGISQLKHLLGIDLARSHHIHEIIIQAIERADEINLVTVVIGVLGIGLILGLKKINKAIPGSLVAVVVGIVAVSVFGFTELGVKIVGDVPDGLPAFGIPNMELSNILALMPIALTISLVGLMESIAVAKAVQSKHKNYKVIPNQELIALGMANLGAAFFQGFPVTGGFSRTAVNDQAGANTGLASIISALLIIVTLLFLTSLFYFLPNAILAAVIMVAVFGLIDFKEVKFLWKSNKADFFVLIVTFFATLALGIEMGIGVGVILSLALVVYRSSRPHIAVLGRIPDSLFYKNVDRFDSLEQRKDLLIIRPDVRLYFANVNFFRDFLDEQIALKGKDLNAVILNAESMNEVDSTGIHALKDILEDLNLQNIAFYITGLKGPVRDAFSEAGLTKIMNAHSFFICIQDAVNWHDLPEKQQTNNDYQDFISQTGKR